MASNVAVHTISFRGKAGAIFVLLCSSIVLYLIAFVTAGWSFKKMNSGNTVREGLWENCTCNQLGRQEEWHHAVQAMICIGLIGLFLSLLLISIYMCVHTISKNSTIIALVCVCCISVVFMTIGYIIYAVEKYKDSYTLSWSYALSVFSAVLCLVAGIVSVIQLRSAGVRV